MCLQLRFLLRVLPLPNRAVKEKAEARARRGCHQIVHVRDPEAEHLRQLNGKRQRKRTERNLPDSIKLGVQNRQKHAQRQNSSTFSVVSTGRLIMSTNGTKASRGKNPNGRLIPVTARTPDR